MTSSIETAASLGIVASLGGVASSIVRSKVTAAYLGPVGIGMGAEVQQLANLALVPLTAFSGSVLYQTYAREDELQGPRRAMASAVTWLLVFGVVIGATVTTFGRHLLPAEWSQGSEPLIALACIVVVAGALLNVTNSTLTFEAKLGATTALNLANTALGVVLLLGLVPSLGLVGQFLAAAAAPLLLLPWALRRVRELRSYPTRGLALSFDRSFLIEALKLGTASLVAASAAQIALWSIRWRLEINGGPELNGQFQAALAIGSTYLGMILAGIGSFAFPRYAAARDPVELQHEVDATVRFVNRLAPPLVLVALCFTDVVVQLLYSSRFETAVEILRWQLVADVAKCLSWAYAGPLLYRGRIRAFMVTEFFAAGLLGTSTWLLVTLNGADGVGQAYLITYLTYLPLSVTVTSISLKIKPDLRQLAIGFAATAALLAVSRLESGWLVRTLGVGAATAWLLRAGLLQRAVNRLRKTLLAH